MSQPPIRTFSYHYRNKYGHKVGKLPLDLGQLCPNRLQGGCIFCSPASFTPFYLTPQDGIKVQITRGKKSLLSGRFRKYFAYFQQESCTAIDPELLISVLQQVFVDEDCLGAILSTRPDYVEDSLLDVLVQVSKKSGKEIIFELGIQTVHQRSLKFLNRNHTFADFENAVSRIQQRSCFDLGAHLIFGIPGEDRKDMLTSVQNVCNLGVNALKLHHLQVIKDTPLHTLYQQGEIQLFSKAQYLNLLLEILPNIPATVTIHRLWSTAHPQLLVAPQWNCLASELSNTLRKQMVEQRIWQGKKHSESHEQSA